MAYADCRMGNIEGGVSSGLTRENRKQWEELAYFPLLKRLLQLMSE